MAIVFKRDHSHYQIGIWRIEESLGELEAKASLLLINDKAPYFKSIQRRKEWLSIRILLYELLGVAAVIAYTESGKPYLRNSHYSIGITHSKGYAALIISPFYTVSIDLETPPFSQINRVASRVFSAEEFFYTAREASFFEPLIWCAKETLYKLIDKQGVIYKEELIVLPFRATDSSGTFQVEVRRKDLSFTQIINYFRSEDFVCTYALK